MLLIIRITVLAEDCARLEVVDDFGVFFEGASHLFPRHKLRDLFSQLPELFKIDVAVG